MSENRDRVRDKLTINRLIEVALVFQDHYERSICRHEEVKRGGSIWTICEQCGKKWADDKGGFQPFTYPLEVIAAERVLREVSLPRVSKPRVTATAIKAAKARALDMLDMLEGRGRYHGDMGNFCYGDGIFANSIRREFGDVPFSKLRKWAKS